MLTGAIIGALIGLVIALIQMNNKKKKEAETLDSDMASNDEEKKEE